MAEYIEREAAIEALPVAWDSAINALKNMPAADVVPIEHGHWEKRRNSWYCTNCGKGYIITYGMLAASAYSYCPNCGAKMDGGTKNAID